MSHDSHGKHDLRIANIRAIEIFAFCAAAVFVLLGTYSRTLGDPATSRLATVYSLAKWGTFAIDRPVDQSQNPFESETIDKVMVNGRVISSKPPVMPLVMTAEYLAMNRLFGWDLDNERDVRHIAMVMTLTLVGFAYLGTILFFARTVRLFCFDPLTQGSLLFFLVFGTQLWGFSTLLNNHVPGACMLMISVYFALGLGYGKLKPTPLRFFGFGLAAGLTVTVDMPGAIWPFMAAVFLLVKFPRQTLTWALLGAAIPLALQSGVLYAVTGSPLPVQMRGELYLHETAYWRHPLGIDGLNEPKGTYLFHMTFGRCGLFSLFPIMLIGVWAACRALFDKKMQLRKPILLGALGFLLQTTYYCLSTNNYGGETYGFRWYIAAMPILLLMAIPVLSRLRTRWHWLIVAIMFGVSLYSAWESTQTDFLSGQEWTCRIFGPSFTSETP